MMRKLISLGCLLVSTSAFGSSAFDCFFKLLPGDLNWMNAEVPSCMTFGMDWSCMDREYRSAGGDPEGDRWRCTDRNPFAMLDNPNLCLLNGTKPTGYHGFINYMKNACTADLKEREAEKAAIRAQVAAIKAEAEKKATTTAKDQINLYVSELEQCLALTKKKNDIAFCLNTFKSKISTL